MERKRLEFTADAHNTGDGYYDDLGIRFDEPGPGWNVEIVSGTFNLPDLEPHSTVSTPENLVLRAPAADADIVKTQILAGQRTHVAGNELFQLRLPALAVDQVTEDAFDGSVNDLFNPKRVTVTFANSTALLDAAGPGMLLLENPAGHHMYRYEDIGGVTWDTELPGFTALVSSAEFYVDWQEGQPRTTRMLEVVSKSIVDGKPTFDCIKHGSPWLGGALFNSDAYRGLVDNLRDGVVECDATSSFDGGGHRNPYMPPLGNSALSDFEDQQRAGAVNLLLQEKRVRHRDLSELNGFFTSHFPFNTVHIVTQLTKAWMQTRFTA